MIRLSLKFNCLNAQEFLNELSRRELDIGAYDYYQSFKLWQYRHMFNIKMGDSSITLALQFNDDKRIDSIGGFLEFNPNKILPSRAFNSLFSLLFTYCEDISLKRWDLAIDIPCSREEVALQKDQRKYAYLEDRGGITEYLGCRSSDGFVKLYDKTRESDLEYPLTRLELTIEGFKMLSDINMPVVRKSVSQTKLDALVTLTGTDLVLYQLMIGLEESEKMKYLKRLGRKKSEKLKPYLFAVDTAYDIPSSIYNKLVEQLKLYTKIKIK